MGFYSLIRRGIGRCLDRWAGRGYPSRLSTDVFAARDAAVSRVDVAEDVTVALPTGERYFLAPSLEYG